MYKNIINAADLNTNINNSDWVIVDCRFSLADTEEGRRNYMEAHIPGSVYAHLDDDLSGKIIKGETGRHPLPKVKAIAERFSSWGIDKNVQVVAYDDKNGAIAARLWWMLRWLGHENVAVLNGGLPEWLRNGYPMDNNTPEKEARSFKANGNDEFFFDFEEVEVIRDDADYSLVDSRTAPRYRGEEEPIDPIAGHIPGAINLPFPENWDENGLMKDKEWLKDRFDKATGGKSDDNVVFYCGSGVTACHNILAYHFAGLGDAWLYPGSWSGWIARDGEVG
jgi:thiosulfate/3-mercaptopyruvate sulfurtransferase